MLFQSGDKKIKFSIFMNKNINKISKNICNTTDFGNFLTEITALNIRLFEIFAYDL